MRVNIQIKRKWWVLPVVYLAYLFVPEDEIDEFAEWLAEYGFKVKVC